MPHYKYRNINSAFYGLIQKVHERKFDSNLPMVETESRNGPVVAFTEPVIITYERPLERVLFSPQRDANCFFHLVEAIWMLSGSNLVKSVAYFTPNMLNYSDDGITLNGAYGYRWRNAKEFYETGYYKHDQLDLLIEHLRTTPNSRRAVLQMWNVEDDLLKIGGIKTDPYSTVNVPPGSKDVCCLSWDTKFRSPEGDINIQTLAKNFQTQKGFKYPVYAVDTQTGDNRLAWMTNAWKTGYKKTFKLNLDDGTSIRLTGDHIVFRKKRLHEGKRCVAIIIEECKVCDLIAGDHLLANVPENAACRTTKSSNKNRTRYRYTKRNLFKNTSRTNMLREHREYLKFLGIKLLKDHSIHHKDGDGLNNKSNNLEQLDNHTHYGLNMKGSKNPHCRMSDEEKAARGKKHSVAIKEFWDSMTAEERKEFVKRRNENRSEQDKLQTTINRSKAAKLRYSTIPKEVRSAYATSINQRTLEQKEAILLWKSSQSNHKILSIEDGGTTAVYDFTVPGRHNAVLNNGVLVHNCNLCVSFHTREITNGADDEYDRRRGARPAYYALDMTVFNRSNDMIWGALGANQVHFSFLQQYIAECCGFAVGVYNQISSNMHVYLNNWNPEEWLKGREHSECYPELTKIPLVKDKVRFDEECKLLVDNVCKDHTSTSALSEPYLNQVVVPMVRAFNCHKARNYSQALTWMKDVVAPDWRKAGTEWLQRREANWKAKQEKVELL